MLYSILSWMLDVTIFIVGFCLMAPIIVGVPIMLVMLAKSSYQELKGKNTKKKDEKQPHYRGYILGHTDDE